MQSKCPSKVFIYRNLHYKGYTYSVKCLRLKRVIERKSVIIIKDAQLVVNQKGRQRVLREKRKNVHAGVKGQLLSRTPVSLKGLKKIRISYNPYHCNHFTGPNGEAILNAKYVVIRHRELFAYC